jgi:hypothetical protein
VINGYPVINILQPELGYIHITMATCKQTQAKKGETSPGMVSFEKDTAIVGIGLQKGNFFLWGWDSYHSTPAVVQDSEFN